jgi:hypothetical protein
VLPVVADFAVMESNATVVVGATTYPDCRVIYLPPSGLSPSALSVDTAPGTVVDDQARIDVRKDQVPALKEGATITGPMDGMPSRTYRVTRVESRDPQYHWAWVR